MSTDVAAHVRADPAPRRRAPGAGRRLAVRVADRGGGAALIAVAVLGVVALVHGLGATGFQAADDLAQMAAAGTAAAAAPVHRPRARPDGCAGPGSAPAWAAWPGRSARASGATTSCSAGRETPFPSLADVGFLLFPVGVVVGLYLFPTSASGRLPVGRSTR